MRTWEDHVLPEKRAIDGWETHRGKSQVPWKTLVTLWVSQVCVSDAL